MIDLRHLRYLTLLALLTLTACVGQVAPPSTEPQVSFATVTPDAGAVAIAPTAQDDTVIATPVPTLASTNPAPTETSLMTEPLDEQSPDDVFEQTINLTVNEVVLDGGALVSNIAGAVLPAQEPVGPDMGYPEHLRFTFDLPEPSPWFAPSEPQLRILPIGDYRLYGNGLVAERIDRLQQLLAERPQSFVGTPQSYLDTIPLLPALNAFQNLHTQVEYLDFAGGQGLRYVTQYAQDVSPILDSSLFYTFQGVSADGEYYLSLVYPVQSGVLPATFEETELSQTEDWAGFTENFGVYIAETYATLDSQPADAFSPSLTELDQLAQSLQFDPSRAAFISNRALLDSVEVVIAESFPVQVFVQLTGNFPDGCTYLHRVRQDGVTDNVIQLTAFTRRPSEVMCTQALEPFTERVPLDLTGLVPGNYTVEVNGVSAPLTLDPAMLAVANPRCPPVTNDLLVYLNEDAGYCAQYPAQATVNEPVAGVVEFSQVTPSDANPNESVFSNLAITAEPLNGRTLEELADQGLQGFGELPRTRQPFTIAGQPAILSDPADEQTVYRIAFVTVGDTAYIISILPYPTDGTADTLWDTMLTSLVFLQ